MRVAILAALVALAPMTGAWAADKPRRDRRADDSREMREAMAMLGAVIAAVSQPPERVDDAPWLLKESLRTGVVDPAAMGALIRWVLYEKEEKVAAALSDALATVGSDLQGIDGERYGAAARSVIGVFEGVLRDAEHNRRRDGDSLLRELRPAIDAAADALRQVQEKADASAPPEPAPQKHDAPDPDDR